MKARSGNDMVLWTDIFNCCKLNGRWWIWASVCVCVCVCEGGGGEGYDTGDRYRQKGDGMVIGA